MRHGFAMALKKDLRVTWSEGSPGEVSRQPGRLHYTKDRRSQPLWDDLFKRR